jgi:hypothetical protein
MDLESIKKTIESLNKTNQIEILEIIQKGSSSLLNENKNGIYVNMTFLSEEVIEDIVKHIEYIKDQELILTSFESQKDDFKNTFFIEKEVKDLMIYNFK